MDFSANHVNFVLACYGISIVMLIIMSTAIVMRSKSADKQLARLEKTRKRRRKPVEEKS